MVLSDKVIKDLTIKLLEKLKTDKDIQVFFDEIIKMYELEPMYSFDDVVNEFEDAMDEAIEEVENNPTTLEINSTIWVNGKNIVQRDLRINSDLDEDYSSAVFVKGTQLFNKDEQKWDYTLGNEDNYYEQSFDFTGELSNSKGSIKDNIKIKSEDITVIEYKAEETKKKQDHTFEREVIFDDGYFTTLTFGWHGDNNYAADKMSSSNEIIIDTGDNVLVSIFADITGNVVKGADFPDEKTETIIDIGSMSEEEIYEYIEEKVSPELDTWMEEVLGDLLNELGVDPAYLF